MDLRHASATDTGRARSNNEDSYLDEPPLVAVADGMGGHAYGEVASDLAIEVLKEWKSRLDGQTANEAAETLREAFAAANQAVFEKGAEDETLAGMGTTLTAAWIDQDAVAIAHVGDSRMYLLRGNKLKQLTEDQTVAQELVRRGRIREDELESSPHRHYLLQAIGNEAELNVDVSTVPIKPGDRLLVATDGLYGMVQESAEIKQILKDHTDADEACRALIDAANAAGGQDNISVIIVDVPGDPVAADEEEEDEEPEVEPRGAPGAAEPRPHRSRNLIVGGGAVLLLAAMAVVFLVRPTGPNYVVSTRGGVVVILDGAPGDNEEPARGEVLRTFRDEKLDEFDEFTQRQLRAGYPVASLEEAEELITQLPRALGPKDTPTPEPKEPASPSPKATPKGTS